MSKEKLNENQHLAPLETSDMWQLAMGLHLPPGAVLTDDPRGQRIVSFQDEIVYPQKDSTTPPALAALLLTEMTSTKDGASRRFKLPPNSTTLVTILNEASGATGSMGGLPNKGRTIELMEKLFNGFGEALRTLRNEVDIIPRGLGYSQVLVQKNDISFQLLPPLELSPVENRNEGVLAWRALKTSFVNSIVAGATTTSQRSLVSGIKPIVEKSFRE